MKYSQAWTGTHQPKSQHANYLRYNSTTLAPTHYLYLDILDVFQLLLPRHWGYASLDPPVTWVQHFSSDLQMQSWLSSSNAKEKKTVNRTHEGQVHRRQSMVSGLAKWSPVCCLVQSTPLSSDQSQCQLYPCGKPKKKKNHYPIRCISKDFNSESESLTNRVTCTLLAPRRLLLGFKESRVGSLGTRNKFFVVKKMEFNFWPKMLLFSPWQWVLSFCGI